MRLAAVFLFAIAGFAPGALACMFHGYIPQETMVDRMLASDHIVLARPSDSDPFHFEAVKALVGELDAIDIPNLVDSGSRRRLAANPEDAVLFASDPVDNTWLRLAYLDADFREIVDRVVARLPDWASGEDADRYEFFANLHGHPDRNIRDLALLELDRADYAALRGLDLRPDIHAIQALLYVPSQMHLRAIRVLLIGLSGDAGARDMLATGVRRMSSTDLPLMGAYATAWLELEGAGAAAALSERFLLNPKTFTSAKELIVEAMAIHSQSGDAATRRAVATELRSVLARAPDLAPAVARQFGARKDWSQRDALAEALKRNAAKWPPADLILVSQYVALATKSAGSN